jgi:sialate O-acetylesterase
MRKYFSLLLSLSSFLLIQTAQSQLRLPAIIASGMVLQQNDSVALWGWAGPAEKVFVSTSWNGHTDSTIVNNGAAWKLKVKTPAAGGPYTITIKNNKSIVLDNVLIGEVWVCSGQSNMEMNYQWGIKRMASDIPGAFNKNIRFFQVPKTTSPYPQEDVKASWAVCDSNTIKTFSAVGYYFGKRLNEQLNVPVGLINSSWGGTPAETWTPAGTVNSNKELQEAAAKVEDLPWWPSQPGMAFNGMIAPLNNFNIAGAIWYQGESNTKTNSTYAPLLTAMIEAWRHAWNKEFPFYYVQIAPYAYGNNNIGALLQEAQKKVMRNAKTGMVVITDLVDTVADIHPTMKKEVGNRLANWALAQTYQQQETIYRSPEFNAAEKLANKMLLNFNYAPNGFQVKGKEIRGFYISGANEAWYPATAKLDKAGILVWSSQVKDPVYIRYGFGNTLIGNVFSTEGLPLTPFRTDNWAVDQAEIKSK